MGIRMFEHWNRNYGELMQIQGIWGDCFALCVFILILPADI